MTNRSVRRLELAVGDRVFAQVPDEWRRAIEPMGTTWRKPYLEVAWTVMLLRGLLLAALLFAAAPLAALFFEEPVAPGNLDALADVRAKSPISIAAGERRHSGSICSGASSTPPSPTTWPGRPP